LDLRRPREQRRRTIVEVRASEPAAGDGVRPRLPAQSAPPEELHHGLVHALAHLAPEELDEARLRAEREGLLEPRQGAPVVEARDLALEEVLGDALSQDGICRRR